MNGRFLSKFTSGETAIANAFDAYRNYAPEEFTDEMWDQERRSFSNIRNLSKSKTVKRLAEQRWFEPKSNEYNTFVALMEYKRQKQQEALDANGVINQEVDNEIAEIRENALADGVNEKLFNLAKSNAQIEAGNRLLDLFKNQQEDIDAFGIKIDRTDLQRAIHVLEQLVAKRKAALDKAIAERPEVLLGTLIELPNSQEDLINAEEKRLASEIDLNVHAEDYNSLWADESKENTVSFVNDSGEIESRTLSEKEVADRVDYSIELVNRFIDADQANRNFQQRLRDGGNGNTTTTEIPVQPQDPPQPPVPPAVPPAPVPPGAAPNTSAPQAQPAQQQ